MIHIWVVFAVGVGRTEIMDEGRQNISVSCSNKSNSGHFDAYETRAAALQSVGLGLDQHTVHIKGR